jgi:hypothetical protein
LEEDFRWTSSTVEAGERPIDFLYTQFASDVASSRLRNEANLVSEQDFCSRVISLEDIAEADWPEWSQFFVEYERVSRAVQECRRTSFIVKAEGAGALLPMPAGVGLSTRRWDDWLHRNDMFLFGAACVHERETGLETDLVTALVSALAGWDPDLCERLAERELAELIRPAGLLEEFASERGWAFSSWDPSDACWAIGLWHTYLGLQRPHTSFAAFLNGSRFIDNLIWRAEIGVLMPYIEEKRRQLIEQYRAHLKVPFETKFGVIDEVYDLEIGHVEFLLSRSLALSKRQLLFVSQLKEARNTLAHLSPVDSDLLLEICSSVHDN